MARISFPGLCIAVAVIFGAVMVARGEQQGKDYEINRLLEPFKKRGDPRALTSERLLEIAERQQELWLAHSYERHALLQTFCRAENNGTSITGHLDAFYKACDERNQELRTLANEELRLIRLLQTDE